MILNIHKGVNYTRTSNDSIKKKYEVSADIQNNVKKIYKKNYTILLQLISSHNDIVKNNAIDELSKNAINLQNIEKLLFTFDDIQKNAITLWKNKRQFSKKNKIYAQFHVISNQSNIKMLAEIIKNAYLSSLCN